MTTRSVIEIDLKDEKFQNFLKTFKQYQTALKSMPSAWKQINALTNGSAISFRGLVAEQVASTVKQKLLLQAQERADQITKTTADRWKDMARSAKSVASYVTETTRQLLRWASLSGIIGGLVGAGSLWGLDRLGGNVAAGRRSALGLGTSYGAQRAFELNYARLLKNPGGVLGGVNEALSDVTKRYTLYGAGLSEQDIAGKDTAQVSALVVSSLKRLFDQTPESQLGNVIGARGLGQFLGLEDAKLLKRIAGSEVGGTAASFAGDTRSLSLTEKEQKAWQDFTTQLNRAGGQIETIFQRKLGPLAPAVEKLSKAFVNMVNDLDDKKIDEWSKKIGQGLEDFATYLGSDEFHDTVKSFAQNVKDFSIWVGNAATWIKAHIPHVSSDVATVLGPVSSAMNDTAARVYGPMNRHFTTADIQRALATGAHLPPSMRHNPGNLRPPGASTGFASFSSDDAGVAAIARQLGIYQDRDKLSTISDIINKYAPGSENNTASYIGDVSRTTGYGAGQQLNLHDKNVLAALTSAITKHEGVRYYSPGAVKLVIEGNAGSNVNVTASKLVGSP